MALHAQAHQIVLDGKSGLAPVWIPHGQQASPGAHQKRGPTTSDPKTRPAQVNHAKPHGLRGPPLDRLRRLDPTLPVGGTPEARAYDERPEDEARPSQPRETSRTARSTPRQTPTSGSHMASRGGHQKRGPSRSVIRKPTAHTFFSCSVLVPACCRSCPSLVTH